MSNKIIRGVWTGPQLSVMQQICVKSYMAAGHEFHLYISEPTVGIPDGAIIHATNTIQLKKGLKDFACDSHFSDYFRVSLILQEGGWYVDLDTLCLRAFDFPEPYVFVSENECGRQRNPKDPFVPNSEQPTPLLNGCIFKAPAGCDYLRFLVKHIEEMNTRDLKTVGADWLAVGPALFREFVPKFGLTQYVKAPCVFDAISPDQKFLIISDGVKYAFSDMCRAVHFRWSAWGIGSGLDPNKTHPSDSFWEQWKRQLNVGGASVTAPFNLAATVQPYTMASPERVQLLIDLARRTNDEDIPGDMVECGVCNGGAAAVLAHFAAKSHRQRQVWLFDSFEGLPFVTAEDVPSVGGTTAASCVGQCRGSIDTVKDVLTQAQANMEKVHIVKGWFKDTLPTFAKPYQWQIAMLNLDSDWYESEKLCLQTFYDNVAKGGFIYFDDYYYWPGCQRAAVEFFAHLNHDRPKILHQVGHSMWLQKSEGE